MLWPLIGGYVVAALVAWRTAAGAIAWHSDRMGYKPHESGWSGPDWGAGVSGGFIFALFLPLSLVLLAITVIHWPSWPLKSSAERAGLRAKRDRETQKREKELGL